MKNLGMFKKNMYFDSVTLMGISKRLSTLPGVNSVSVSMGTDMNKQLLKDGDFDDSEVQDASPNDLMIVCTYDDDVDHESLIADVEDALVIRSSEDDGEAERPKTLRTAHSQSPANLAVISVPGEYAGLEARKALRLGMNVMLFSDNVSVEDEADLKQYAHEHGLLVMGPDCGTAIINGCALCFANHVEQGPIGIVAASGTGAQEVSVLLSEMGLGTSHLIGTGGRDLSESIGGRMFLDAFAALEADDATTHIVLISKPPHPDVADKVFDRVTASSKPVVVCFLGVEGEDSETIKHSPTLEGAVLATLKLAGKPAQIAELPDSKELSTALEAGHGGYVRALYCGGTLTEEARSVFHKLLPAADVHGNTTKIPAQKLDDVSRSVGNTFLDMGEDHFTRGKPHPMIDPELRNPRILQEAADPATRVIILDFVLGYGAHMDPVGVAHSTLVEVTDAARAEGRALTIVAYVLGTDEDPQNKTQQIARLRELGVVVCDSNAQAARVAAAIIQEG